MKNDIFIVDIKNFFIQYLCSIFKFYSSFLKNTKDFKSNNRKFISSKNAYPPDILRYA